MAKMMVGETQDILKIMPSEQLIAMSKIRHDVKLWEAIKAFARDQKLIKMDQIYRLRRPKSQDDLIKNLGDHEYYAGRIAELAVILQIMENASDELERRERKEK